MRKELQTRLEVLEGLTPCRVEVVFVDGSRGYMERLRAEQLSNAQHAYFSNPKEYAGESLHDPLIERIVYKLDDGPNAEIMDALSEALYDYYANPPIKPLEKKPTRC